MTTPKELQSKFKAGSAEHGKLSDAVHDRLRMSYRKMSGRYSTFAQCEEQFQAYVPESDADAIRRQNRESFGAQHYRTLEIPYSYAVLMTAHTYWTTVFLARDPVFQYRGRHGEGEDQVQAVEALIDYQKVVGEWGVPLFIWLLDPGKYGFGIIGHYWDKKTVQKRTVRKVQDTFLGVPIPGKIREEVVVEEVVQYEGNNTYNVRPADFFPDTRLPLKYFNKGEFCAHYCEIPWLEIREGVASGRYFNLDALRGVLKTGDHDVDVSRDLGSSRVSQLPDTGQMEPIYNIPISTIKAHLFYVRLIPSQWGFGPENKPEVWCISRSASGGVIFGIEPLGENTDDFPFDIIEAEPEGYNLFSRSMLENVKPMSDVLSWLINTHFYNVRSALNNQFIVDPSMVEMTDFNNPAARIIRLRPIARGRDVRSFFSQLQIADVTRNHLSDARIIEEFFQKVLGVNDNLMGILDQGGRKTATEVRTSTSFGINRLKTLCEYYSLMGFEPFGRKVLQRTQTFYTAEQKLRIAGSYAMQSSQVINVDAQSIAGFYDLVPVNGTLPVDRYAQAQLLNQLLAQIGQNPQLLMQYDILRLVEYGADLAGIKNLGRFRMQQLGAGGAGMTTPGMNVVPDDQLQNQIQAGNVVPMRDLTRVPDPGRLPGMGATG